MRKVLAAALIALWIAGAGSAAASKRAPPNPGAAVGEVVVQGQTKLKLPKNLPEIVSKDIVARAQPSHTGNLTRWVYDVCPGVAGLTPQYASFVAKRIVDVSRGYVPNRRKCTQKINVLVVFTDVPQQLMDDVRDHHPGLLGYHFIDEKKRLATFIGPIEAWYLTATGGYIDNAYLPVGTGTPVSGVPPGAGGGRLRNGLISSMVFVLVVVDSKATQDQPIGTVADRIAALVLSKTTPRTGCSPFPTVLDALDPACPQSASLTTLSDYDRSFLKALYSSDPEEVGQAERGSVMLQIMRDAKHPAGPTEAGESATPPPP
jgi:hypothetical protein